MPGCIGVKRDGSLCQRDAAPDSDYCSAHDPSRTEERRRAASKAAKAKRSPRSEVEDIKTTLADLARKVEEGKMDRADASVSGQLWNLVMRGIELQRRLRESEELEKRLEALEARWEMQKWR